MFHVSENKIEIFEPKKFTVDAQVQGNFVWAIGEKLLHNYILPRECPRVCYYSKTFNQILKYRDLFDLQKPFVVLVPKYMKEKILNTSLYIHQFSPNNFRLIDVTAQYFVSEITQKPIKIFLINEILEYFAIIPL